MCPCFQMTEMIFWNSKHVFGSTTIHVSLKNHYKNSAAFVLNLPLYVLLMFFVVIFTPRPNVLNSSLRPCIEDYFLFEWKLTRIISYNI